jgi:hypothetical protein
MTIERDLIYVDFHTHLYPTLVEGGTWRHFQGVSWTDLKSTLVKRESETYVRQGVLYGPHHFQLLKEAQESYHRLSPEDQRYLAERVIPMVEHHGLQTICAVSNATWNEISPLRHLDELGPFKKQIDLIKYLADQGGIAIIDIPNPHGKGKRNGVYRGFPGAATIEQLDLLGDLYRQRTFLCYNAMEPGFMRGDAEEMARLTGLKLVGGSDAIGSAKSLFSAYSEVNGENMADLLKDPKKYIGKLHKGAVPTMGEAFRRWFVCGVIELQSSAKREAHVERHLRERLISHEWEMIRNL